MPRYGATKLNAMVGRCFGRLTVTAVADVPRRRLYCRCECGVEKEVPYDSLTRGSSKSCGCLSRELVSERFRTHGATNTKVFNVWRGIVSRCTCKTHAKYDCYGGRGIKVCPRWQGKGGFKNFMADMGPRPTPQHEVERADNDGNYEPTNCRWATRKEQCRNTRGNRLLTFQGKTQPAIVWAEELNLSLPAIRGRLRRGWAIDRVLSTPQLSNKKVTG